MFQCRLPKGAGLAQSVVVSASGQFAQAKPLLGYALPNITGLSGCVAGSTRYSVVECVRAGSQTLTVEGNNFGAAVGWFCLRGRAGFCAESTVSAYSSAQGAQVFVGSEACTQPAHDQSAPHEKVDSIRPLVLTISSRLVVFAVAQLTCRLPSGNRLDRTVIVVQSNGEHSPLRLGLPSRARVLQAK